MSETKQKVIAFAAVSEMPPYVKTLEQWSAWRREEDARMLALVLAQLDAHFERICGATEH